jgi:lipopolysaccharide heptosyltransferase II
MRELKITGRERILVIRTDRIGDVVLSTPVLEAIKQRFPQSHITMTLSSYTAEVVRNNPHLDDVIIEDHENRHRGMGDFFMMVKEIRKRRFDVGILLRPTLRLALMLFLGGIKYRIGTGYRFYQIFFNKKIYEHRKINLKHEVEYNLNLLKPLGIAQQGIIPKLYLLPEERKFVQQIMAEFKITPDDVVVGIHPGSGDSSLNLPPKRFAQVADKLVEEINAKIVFTGTEKEKGLVDFIKNNMTHGAVDLTGRTNLRQLASVLAGCDVVISNSTGPMHLAVSVGTPTVAIFCPIFSAGPIRWGPYGEGHQVILPPVPVCFKCNPRSCPHYDCMEKIKADQIVSKACALLEKRVRLEKSRK